LQFNFAVKRFKEKQLEKENSMRLTLVNGAAVLALLAGSVVAQNAQHKSFAATRPGVTPHAPKSVVHPFVNKKFFSGVGVPSTVMLSDFNNSAVYIYDESGTLQATYTSGLLNPQGMTTDRQGNLYVANTDASNIEVFASGNPNPVATWNDTEQYPVDIDVRNNGAFGAATNIFSPTGAPGSVSLFRNGVMTANVTDPAFDEVFFGAFDKGGNFYFDGINTSGEVFIAVIPHANLKGPWTVQYLSTDNSLEFPGGVQVDNNGNISVDDQEAFAIYTYAPPSGGSLGAPISTTSLSGSEDPVTFTFKTHNNNLYTGDISNVSNEYKFSAGGSPENSITCSACSELIGTAVTPAQMP
jgi:hypothetical protein